MSAMHFQFIEIATEKGFSVQFITAITQEIFRSPECGYSADGAKPKCGKCILAEDYSGGEGSADLCNSWSKNIFAEEKVGRKMTG